MNTSYDFEEKQRISDDVGRIEHFVVYELRLTNSVRNITDLISFVPLYQRNHMSTIVIRFVRAQIR